LPPPRREWNAERTRSTPPILNNLAAEIFPQSTRATHFEPPTGTEAVDMSAGHASGNRQQIDGAVVALHEKFGEAGRAAKLPSIWKGGSHRKDSGRCRRVGHVVPRSPTSEVIG